MSNSFIMTESIVRPAKMPYGRLKDNGFVGIEGEHAARALVVETKDDLSAFASVNLIIDDLDCGAMTKTTSGSTTTLSMTLTSSMIGRSGRKICQLIMVNSGNTVVQKSSQFEAYVGRANEIERSVDDGVTIIILSEAVTEMAREAAAAAAEEAAAGIVDECQEIADAASASADAAAQSASDAQTAAASITVDAALDPTSTHAIQNKAVASEISSIKADLGDKLDAYLNVDFSIDNKRVNSMGSIVESNGQRITDYYPCSEGTVVKWHGKSFIYGGASVMCLIAFFDADKAFITGITSVSGETTSVIGDVSAISPAGTAYVVGSTTIDASVANCYLHVYDANIARMQNESHEAYINVDQLKSDVTSLIFGNAPTRNKVIGKRNASAVAYDIMTINVEAGRRYRLNVINVDALVGADLYLRLRKVDNSGNAYTAPAITGDVVANTKYTYYFDCITTESVYVQIYRDYLTEDATISFGVICDDDRRDISSITSDLTKVTGKVDLNISRNLIGPDLDVLYPVPPLKTGDVVTASAFNPSNVTSWCHVQFHSSDGTRIAYFQFDSTYSSTGRQVTLNLGDDIAYFISISHDCGSPVMVERGTKTDFIPHYTTNYENYLNNDSNFGEFELFIPDQASIIRSNLAVARMTKRLCFGHVSDNHSTKYQLACDIIDQSDAKFMVNTGDIVQDKYSDAYTNVPTMINAMTKPHYITLGNHDVYKASSASDIFTKYFDPIKAHNGQSDLTTTYYSVDFPDEGIKCIFLDHYDGLADYDVSMNTVIAGKMSSTQINWFMSQLDDALTNSMHVCIYMHLAPEEIGEKSEKFFDYNTTDSRLASYAFIADIIDAFMDGESVTFTTDGTTYSHTFNSSGVFVGYFCGHTHYDCVGKLKTHTRQNAFTVTRPWQSPTAKDKEGVYRHGSSKWGFSAFNYVTIDPNIRHVSIMRVLQQDTKYGFKRDFVTVDY